MIGRLRGLLVERDGADILVECGGVGYEVTVSAHTLAGLPPVGGEVTLRVFTHARESGIALFGFGSGEEKALFDLLITVKNVGPTAAMGILSAGAGPHDIARMIAAAELAALVKLRGVGKKTAELLVVELRDKCELLLATWGASGAAPRRVAAAAPVAAAARREPILDDVATALVQLGWRAAEAEGAVAQLEVTGSATIESLLRQALRSMPR